jgi:HAD superfamily hydrolase (TIGR01490 family)
MSQQSLRILKGLMKGASFFSVIAATPNGTMPRASGFVMNKQPIAAIFDVDGTLLGGASMEVRFLNYLWRYGELRVSDFTRLAAGIFRTVAQGRPMIRANKAYLYNKPLDHVRRLAQDCFDQHIRHYLLPKAVARVRWHQQQGHCVVLVSGTLDLLLEPLQQYLNACSRIGTQIEVAGNALLGKIEGEQPYDKGKAKTLLALNQFRNFDLTKSFAYGNHFTDRHLLGVVGHPVATNPDHRLRTFAAKQGWMIEEFGN